MDGLLLSLFDTLEIWLAVVELVVDWLTDILYAAVVACAEPDFDTNPVLVGDWNAEPVCPHSEGLIIEEPDWVLAFDVVYVWLFDMLETGLAVCVFWVNILGEGIAVSDADGLFVDVILAEPE